MIEQRTHDTIWLLEENFPVEWFLDVIFRPYLCFCRFSFLVFCTGNLNNFYVSLCINANGKFLIELMNMTIDIYMNTKKYDHTKNYHYFPERVCVLILMATDLRLKGRSLFCFFMISYFRLFSILEH